MQTVSNFEKRINKQIIDTMRNAISEEQSLRESLNLGEELGYVPKKLKAILNNLESTLDYRILQSVKSPPWKRAIAEDETLVYIYLYNLNGKHMRNWEKMLVPNAMTEYGFNRPIYQDKEALGKFLDINYNEYCHAHLGVIIKKSDIEDADTYKDPLGQSILRVTEGALKYDNILEFTHMGIPYYLNHRRLAKQEDWPA